MLRGSDDFWRLLKKQIDGILAEDENLQKFLLWAKHKADSVQTNYKTVAVRAYYFESELYALDIAIDYAIALILAIDHNLAIVHERVVALVKRLNSHEDSGFNSSEDSGFNRSQSSGFNRPKSRAFHAPESILVLNDNGDSTIVVRVPNGSTWNDNNSMLAVSAPDGTWLASIVSTSDSIKLNSDLNLDSKLASASKLSGEHSPDIEGILKLASDMGNDVLQQKLLSLKDRLPYKQRNSNHNVQWWLTNGQEWIGELRQLCIDHRNICHNWKFTGEQVQLLAKYFKANLLLVECMNRSYVSKQVREEIEATMLLPRKK
ncbi:NACHT C-terminal helical domain 2-containing protein [Pseudanabaena yagii]|uniref:NACHT conflict system C-terminal helical domain-containing protein n=1 Tax=Pseudanabaena yagii GIHE-NHR1 TaxID=2722753 RepID=A0ABX1LNV2_9CYAN|nr:hypothetical protein [Pseudanabaena yagii]NMF56696.1 hypothetical protein [Pseudanabaena yagii GIHE-NHR1]